MSEPAAYTAEHVRAAIERPPVAELGIEVSIDGDGRIRLAGPVCSDEQHAAVLDAVRRQAPGAVIIDQVSVSHRPPDGTVEPLS